MVNIDTVYQRVLALANKEQRGYITPQEFNLFANQAQMDIFEQYFYDLNQFLRTPGNDTAYSDMVTLLEEKISLFETTSDIDYDGGGDLPINIYRLGTVRYNNDGKHIPIERVSEKELRKMTLGPLTRPTKNNPVYTVKGSSIHLAGITPESLKVSYTKKPVTVNWTYVVVGEKPLVNVHAGDYRSFELHPSEETKLVIKILALAGIAIKDPSLYQVAGAEDNKNIQQEKQ
jgi:hypothetical protein